MCVISLGINSPSPPGHPKISIQDYSGGITRMKEDLIKFNFQGDFIAWIQHYPENSPPHEESPWGFKPFCFQEAHRLGYQYILWLDASIRIKQPLEPLFELISKDGYLMFQESHSVGEYCKDEALETLKITREESFELPCCRSGVLGLNLSDLKSGDFLQQWKEKATDGITFPGPKWSGVRGWPKVASQDPRVKGHRHDQTAASVIALRLGMNQWKSADCFQKFFSNERETIRVFQDYEEYVGDDRLQQLRRSGKHRIRLITTLFRGYLNR
jgi:hypothetical protein